MHLTSSAFANGMAIPRRYSCDGDDVSPPLNWSEVPAATRSFMLLCEDPDAPPGTWHHWAAYDIPAEVHALPEGAAQHAGQMRFHQAVNDFDNVGYGGPCPPHGHGHHRYHFRLLALSVERLSLGKNPSCRDVERAARPHALAEAVLVGIYQR